jgi:hypothetical protein
MNYCSFCFNNATIYGEIFSGYTLIMWGKPHNFSIVEGHNEVFRFPKHPVHDPGFNINSDEELNRLLEDENFCEADSIFCDAVEQMRATFIFSPQIGHELVEACKAAGWKELEHGWLDYWVMHRAATMIKEATV